MHELNNNRQTNSKKWNFTALEPYKENVLICYIFMIDIYVCYMSMKYALLSN